VSALTKVFVVLQVILAILLSAGIIVFVNRTEDNRGLYNDAKASLGQANRQVANLQATAKAIEQQFNSDLQNKNSDLAQTQARLQDLQTQLDSTKTSLASAQADLDKSTASNTFASQALKVALDQNGTLQSQYSDLQKALASMQKDNANGSANSLPSRISSSRKSRMKTTSCSSSTTSTRMELLQPRRRSIRSPISRSTARSRIRG
jgi:septal ring factor EnvC (AmiA/AmiB activator)